MARKILYIDDNAINLQFARRVLVGMGYELVEADTAVSGLEAVMREQPDLVLMDINLPDYEGTQATVHLKSMPETCHIPVIALTANDSERMRRVCIEAGCDAYLAKPISPAHLLEAVQRYVS